MNEVWKDVVGFEGMYQVSNLGNIKSFKNKKPRILKPSTNKSGYVSLCLRKDGKTYGVFVHGLVAKAFIPNPDNLPEVNHKDEDKSNNKLSNLEWCDKKYNNTYGTKIARVVANTDYSAIADKNSLAINQLDKEGNFIRTWKSAPECKRETGFDNSSIAKCCRGLIEHAYGFKWEYVNEEQV